MLLLGAEEFSRECHIYFGLHHTSLDWPYNSYFPRALSGHLCAIGLTRD